MAEQTIKCKLIDFSEMKGDSEELKCHNDAFNSFYLKISELENYKEVEEFTECEKCKMVLTDLDKDYIEDWEWVKENQAFYSDIEQKLKTMKENPWNYLIWNCRFCSTKNLLQKNKIYFAKNKSKVVVNDGLNEDLAKLYCDNPILLFLIDNSSSMEEQIFKDNDEHPSKEFKDQLRKTQIYKKIIDNEQSKIKEINEDLKNRGEEFQKEEYKDHMNKYKILMALTQIVVNQICTPGKGPKNPDIKLFQPGPAQQSKVNSKKIGFIFFNSDVLLQKSDGKIIKISEKHFSEETSSESHQKVDFNSYSKLFQCGRKNSKDYGSNLSTFSFKNIEVKNMTSPVGQTALGPALAIATGIVNSHGPGSMIVLVTDGKGNKGIFSQDGIYEEELKMMKFRMIKAKSQMCWLQLANKNNEMKYDKKKGDNQLNTYLHSQNKMITLNIDTQKSPVDFMKKRLRGFVEKMIDGKTWTNQITIKCQINAIDYQNEINSKKNKLFEKNQKIYFSPKIDESLLNHTHFKHLFMTQVIVSYVDINTRKSSIFMTYFMQKMTKVNEMNKKDLEELQSQQTLLNVIGYLSTEGFKLNFANIPQSSAQKIFRQSIMKSYSYKSVTKLDHAKQYLKFPKPAPRPLIKNYKDFVSRNTEQEDPNQL